MPRPARYCGPPKAVNPASMKLGQLLALPCQTLVLLALARHLVTSCLKAHLAKRIHAFVYSQLSHSGHLCKTDTSIRWTPSAGPGWLNVTANYDLGKKKFLYVTLFHTRHVIDNFYLVGGTHAVQVKN